MGFQTSGQVKEQGQRSGLYEGALNAVMQGVGESFLSAFALLLQSTSFQIGLLTAIPHVIGTWSQLLSVKVLGRFRDRTRLVVTGVTGQALAWIPVFVLPLLFPAYAPWLLIAGAVLYFGMGHFMVPAWNSLLTDLVDANGRGAYFARRAKLVAVATFAALSAGSVILQWTEGWQIPWIGFALLFGLAASARLASARLLAGVRDLAAPAAAQGPARLREFLRHERNRNFRPFLLYSGGLHITAAIAGPFYVVYLLHDLHMTYLQYGVWMAAPLVGQLMTLKEWGRIADKFGNKQVLVLTGLLAPFLPMLYLCSTNWIVLSGVNFLAGVIWSGLGLSLQNYVFDAVEAEDRPKGVAIYNTVNAVSLGVGAMLGSWLATVTPAEIVVSGLGVQFVSNLPVVFFLSGVVRLIVVATLAGSFREHRAVTPISPRQLVHELPLIKPLAEAFISR